MSADYLNVYKLWLQRQSSLKPYVKEHIATDYVEFTESLLAEFLDGLCLIPEFDPNSFVLPVDPLDALSRLYKLDSLSNYEESFQGTKEAVNLLRNFIKSSVSSGKCKSERVIDDDEYGPTHKEEAFSPILTRRTRLATPKLGKKKKGLPKSLKQLAASQYNLEPLKVDLVKEQAVNFEDTLKLKLDLDTDQVQHVRTFVGSLRSDKNHKNQYLDPETSHSRPLAMHDHILSSIEEPFKPIFPRSRRHGTSSNGAKDAIAPINNFKDLVQGAPILLQLVEVVDPDGDIARQNLHLVDGWETIKSSPPSTPSSKSNQIDELEVEVHMPSTPSTTPPLALEIEKLKMDPVLFPRSRRLGGTDGVQPHILHGKTLETFLGPLLAGTTSQTAFESLDKDDNMKSDTENRTFRSGSPEDLSMLGQPPSIVNRIESDWIAEFSADVKDANRVDLDVEEEIKNFYEGRRVELEAIKKEIMNERIEGRQDPLMEVPKLPEPPDFPKNLFMPTSYSDFVIPPLTKSEKGKANMTELKPYQFLKKAKGCQSLGLALSWVTFTTNKKLPSIPEVVDVVHPVPMDSEDHLKAVQLLQYLSLDDRPSDTTEREPFIGCWPSQDDHDTFNHLKHAGYQEEFRIILTRRERQRLARSEGRKEGDDFCDVDELGLDESEQAADADLIPPQPAKQLKRSMEALPESPPLPQDSDVADFQDRRPFKRPRLDDQDLHQPPSMDDILSFAQTSHHIVDSGGYDSGYDEGLQHGYYQDQNVDPAPMDYMQHYMEELHDLADADKENWDPSSSPSFLDERHLLPEEQDFFDQIAQDATDERIATYGITPTYSQPLDCFSGVEDVVESGFIEETAAVPVAQLADPLEAPSLASRNPQDTGRMDFNLEPSFVSHILGIAAFAQLRAKKISQPEASVCPSSSPSDIAAPAPQALRRPDELLDSSTLTLPSTIEKPLHAHKYMASLDFIQKHALVRLLCSDKCLVELVERPSLGGADIIIDTKTAVLFINLFYLPARCDAYLKTVADLSWRFPRLLIVFEGYSEKIAKKTLNKRSHPPAASQGSAAVEAPPEASPYTPPIIKAIKRFRRDLNIAAGCGTKDPNTVVQYSFADNVESAALLTRLYGDMAQATDQTQGAIWGDRAWLDVEYLEEEEINLSSLRGLNFFSTSIILCQATLEDFINLSPEARMNEYGSYIGQDNITACNEDIATRLLAFHTASDTNSDPYSANDSYIP